MTAGTTSARSVFLFVATTLVLGWCLATPAALQAQCTTGTYPGVAGNNAAYGNCQSLSSLSAQGSAAYIDASAVPPGSDFCNTLFNIINGSAGYPAYPSAGAVIDARGISTPVTCGSGSTPWISGTTVAHLNAPATILLPAGTITTSNTWILPRYARIIGEGPGLTTITPITSGFTSDPAETSPPAPAVVALIEMGTQSTALAAFCGGNADCVGVGVQDLTLNLNGVSIPYGIYNATSQELSYVDNVVFNGVGNATTATSALEVTVVSGPSSSNSGPYSNLICNIHSGAAAGTRCVDLVSHTRGVHGLTCNGLTTSPPTAAIYLDSDMNSIEDVYVNGFINGIHIGSQAQAPSNLLFNINGGPNVTDLVHINQNTSFSGTAVCPGGTTRQAVCDLTVMNVTAAANTTIQDDILGTSLTVTGGDAMVGLYILGQQFGTSSNTPQYSRFSSSPRIPTWGVGSTTPGASTSCNASTATGSLYSSVSTGAGGNLFVCVGNQWRKIQ